MADINKQILNKNLDNIYFGSILNSCGRETIIVVKVDDNYYNCSRDAGVDFTPISKEEITELEKIEDSEEYFYFSEDFAFLDTVSLYLRSLKAGEYFRVFSKYNEKFSW